MDVTFTEQCRIHIAANIQDGYLQFAAVQIEVQLDMVVANADGVPFARYSRVVAQGRHDAVQIVQRLGSAHLFGDGQPVNLFVVVEHRVLGGQAPRFDVGAALRAVQVGLSRGQANGPVAALL